MADLTKQLNKLQKLKSLADEPKEQVAYALSLLESERDRQVLGAALAVLKENPEREARPVLLSRYEFYAADGPKRDAGTYLRTDILYALRPLAQHADLPLIEKASLTYETMPSRHDANGALLRSIALTILNDLDEKLAGFYAVKILVDKITSEMSGEPAVTAAKVLAAQGNTLPLCQYLLEEGEHIGEVVAACLRGLEGVPEVILNLIVTKYQFSSSEAVLIGLFDMLLAHPAGENYSQLFTDFLAETGSFEMYRYVAMSIITSGKPKLLAHFLTKVKAEKDPLKQAILRELLSLVKGHQTEVNELLKKLK